MKGRRAVRRSHLGTWIRGCALLVTAAVLSLSSLAMPGHGAEALQTREKFSIIVLPDTQTAPSAQFNATTQWVADNAEARNIQLLLQVGDLVEWPRASNDWDRARAATDRLDGAVPYAIAIGNHDFDAWYCSPPATCDPRPYVRRDHRTTLFNSYYPYSKFAGLPSFGGSHPNQSNDNSYHLFNAGGTDWLALTLKWPPCPRINSDCPTADTDWQQRLDWAEQVIAAHPNRQVIVNTHDYMNANAVRSDGGEDLWLRIKKYDNVQFVLSGHVRSVGNNAVPNDHGNSVFQIVQDYSTYATDYEDSYFRIMTFDPATSSVDVETYSAYCHANPSLGCPPYKTGAAHNFSVQNVRFPQSSSSHQLSRGKRTTATASSAQPGHGAANVLDGDSRTIWGAPWNADGTPSVPLPQSVTLDLGRVRDTTGLRYGPRQGTTSADKNGIVTGYNAYVSVDGTSFAKVTTGTWAFDHAPKAAAWPARPARYVRFEATATGSALGWATAGELNVSFLPEPLASGTGATASSSFPQNPAIKAIDGDLATIWTSDYDPVSGAPTDLLPQSLTIDLGTEQQTTGLYYTPRQDSSTNGRITTYNVYLSRDGQSFAKVAGGAWSSSSAPKPATWPAATARYVRLEAVASVPYQGHQWASAAEVEVVHRAAR